MIPLRKRKYGVVLTVAALIICARIAARYGYYAQPLSTVRTVIYMGLLAAWGISVRTRIIQTQVRRYLLAIAGLMLLWLTLRTVKYNTYNITAECFLWYGCYLPMLFIPVLAVLVALSLGKPENYRLPKGTHFLYLPSVLLFLLVLTNDLHQLVFLFPNGVLSDDDYRYGAGYYVVLFHASTIGALITDRNFSVACAAENAKQAGFYLVAVYDENSAETRKELSALADEIITDWSAAAAALEKAP